MMSAPPPSVFQLPLIGARIIRGRAIPFHVRVGLQDFAQAAVTQGAMQKLRGIVEAMLAHHAQLDAGVVGGFDHAARGVEIGRHGLLHLNVFLRLRRTASTGSRRNSGKVHTST